MIKISETIYTPNWKKNNFDNLDAAPGRQAPEFQLKTLKIAPALSTIRKKILNIEIITVMFYLLMCE